MKKAFKKVTGGLYWLFVEPHLERREMNRDYAKESKYYDHYTDRELAGGINPDTYVMLSDVDELLAKVNARLAFAFSGYDHDLYIKPFKSQLDACLHRGDYDCHVRVFEPVEKYARIKAGDLLHLLEQFDMPDGKSADEKATEDVAVPIEHEFDTSDWLGKLRAKMNEVAPIRTPSIDVKIEQQETDRPLNVKRPLLLAIGFAAMYRPQNRMIESEEIPTLRDTLTERQIEANKPKDPRYYRGIRVD